MRAARRAPAPIAPRARAAAVITCAIACAIASRGAASAATATGVVVVRGGVGASERAAITAAIEAEARGAGWALPTAPIAKRDADALAACAGSAAPWGCVPAALRQIERVIAVQAATRLDGGAPMVVLVGRALLPGERVAVVGERYCAPCAGPQLGEASTELAGQLLRELAVRAGRTALAIKSIPPGATIILDGDRIGATNASLHTYPGTHVVVLEKPGFLIEARQVAVAEGQTAEVSVTLRPSPIAIAMAPLRAPRPPSRLAPGLVIGAGAAALVTGLVLVAVDQDARRDGAQPERYFDSARTGAGYAIAGAAITAAGAAWWTRRTRARRAPAIAISARGAAVTWAWTR